MAGAGVSVLSHLALLHLLCPHQGLPARPRHPGADHHQDGGQPEDGHCDELLLLPPPLDQAGVEGGSASVTTGQNQGDLSPSLPSYLIIIIIIIIIISLTIIIILIIIYRD